MVQENGSHSKLNLVFDTWIDNIPIKNCSQINTTDFPNFLLHRNVNVNYCKPIDVNNNEKFYYIIDHMNNLCDLLDDKNMFLTTEIENLCRDKNLKIMLINRFEINVNELEIMKKLIDIIKNKNLKEKNFYLLNNNPYLIKYKTELNTDINVHTTRFLAEYISNTMNKYDINFKQDKEFLFLCQNRVSKAHRIILLSYLLKSEIINDTNWSLISPNYNYNILYDNVFSTYINENKGLIETLIHVKDKYSIYENKINIDQYEEIIETQNFTNSYINITTETYFSDYEIHISEKSFKSFYFFQLPLFISEYNHLRYMRLMYNFDFFDDLINHSYDLEKNNVKRMHMIFDEIKRLYDNKEQVIEFYKKNKERFYNNQKIVKSILTNNDTANYFNSLIKKESAQKKFI